MKSGWVTKKLGEVCEVQLGKMLDKAKNKGKPYPYLANLSVRWRSFDLSNLRTMPFMDSEIEKFSLRPGDVLMCEGGEPGRCAIWQILDSDIKFQKAVHRIRSRGNVEPAYLVAYFESIVDTPGFQSRLTGATIKHLPRERLLEIPIPIPPLAEQKRIVAKIDAAFEKIDKLKANAEKNLANAKELFQSALDEAMRPKKGWVEKRLGEVCEILDSRRVPITKKDRIPGGVPYYGATGQVDSVADYIFDERLILLGEDGADWSAGANSAYIIEGKSWVNNHAHVLRPLECVVDIWLMYYLNAVDLSKWVSGTTVPKLNQGNMCKIPILVPPLDEQRQIVKRLDFLSEKVKLLEQNYARQIADCAEMRQAILREAFEGRM